MSTPVAGIDALTTLEDQLNAILGAMLQAEITYNVANPDTPLDFIAKAVDYEAEGGATVTFTLNALPLDISYTGGTENQDISLLGYA